MTTTNKTAIKSVTIVWAEGSTEDPTRSALPLTFGSYAEANAHLRLMAATAPSTGGYDKTDFRVEWADGETYEGTYDLKAHDVKGVSHIQTHMRRFAECYSGRVKPAHLTPMQWARFTQTLDAETTTGYGRVLDMYDLANDA